MVESGDDVCAGSGMAMLVAAKFGEDLAIDLNGCSRMKLHAI